MKKISLINIIILSLFIVTSCTTYKKRYSKGYTVDWHKSQKKQKASEKSLVEESPSEAVVVKETEDSELVNFEREEVEKVFNKVHEFDDAEFKLKKKSKNENINHELNSEKENRDDVVTQKKEKKENNSFAILSFALMLATAFLEFFKSNINGLSLVTILFSYILGYIALIQFKKSPEKYTAWTKGLAIISIVVITLFIMILLAVILIVVTFLGGLAGFTLQAFFIALAILLLLYIILILPLFMLLSKE